MLAQAARRNASLQLHCTFVQRNLVGKGPSQKTVAPEAQERTKVKTAQQAQPRSRRGKNSVKVPRKRKTTTRKQERGNTPLTRKNKGPSPRMRASKRGVLARTTQKTLKGFGSNRTAKTVAISGKNRRRKEKVTFLLPVRKDKFPTQVSFLELGTQTRMTRVQAEQGGKGTRGKIAQLSFKGIKNVSHDRKPIRGNRERKAMKADAGFKTKKGSMSLFERGNIHLRGERGGAGFTNPVRISGKIGNSVTILTNPVLAAPGRNNSMVRATSVKTRNGKSPSADETSQSTHVRMPQGVNGISRTNFINAVKRKLMKAMARLN